MTRLFSTETVLRRLDEKQISIWCNQKGWFWAFEKDLKRLPKFSNEPIDMSLIHGPFDSAQNAGWDALSEMAEAA
jgi:hypothetical protein